MSTFKEQGINAHPLAWPMGWKRTTSPERSKFKASFAPARDRIFRELKLLGVPDWNVVLSTNVQLRRDGLPLAGMAQPKDAGVAVYFRYNDKPMVFACDTYVKVEENLHAIALTIEALRGIKRWGASDMMERSFTGFQALPPAQSSKPKREWWDVLEVRRDASPEAIRANYLRLSRDHHPDHGGAPGRMAELNEAWAESRRVQR